MKSSINRKPEIFWDGKDVAPYIYGHSSRVLKPSKKFITNKDTAELSKQIAEHKDRKMFGVKLTPINSFDQLSVGQQVLMLYSIGGNCFTKQIFEIIEISQGIVDFETKWPENHEGFNGFVRFVNMVEEDVYEKKLYLLYEGKLPQKTKKSFFDIIQEMALDLKTLVEVWSICHCPDLKNYISFDPMLGYWLEHFNQKYGKQYHHELVWNILNQVFMDNNLRGINKIYNDKNFPKIDYITPLMKQLQSDILNILYENPEMAEKLFPENQSQYLKKRMRVIFEAYYGPKSMLHIGSGFSDEINQSKEKTIDTKTQKKLDLIEKMIRCPNAFDGVKKAAINVWEKLAKKKFVF